MHLQTTFMILLGSYALAKLVKDGSKCTVTPLKSDSLAERDDTENDNEDDTPQILEAFDECGKDGSIVFGEGTYNIRKVMDTSSLRNCDISILGTFLWSDDNLDYWIDNTFSVDYDHQSTAWLLGGTNISMRGHGKGLFDGNGQAWMDENKNGSNRAGRPINLTVWKARNVLIDGLSWRQSQFWHTFVAYSLNVTMSNLNMNTTSHSEWSPVNTDGFDSWNSRDIYLRNWTVQCGDDCISVKGNSTNIDVKNITCYKSNCACIGSLGKEEDQADFVDDVVFDDVKCINSENAAWIKTYSGIGHVRNVTFRRFELDNVEQPIYVTPCTYNAKKCDESELGIFDINWIKIKGTSTYNITAAMYCSESTPCEDFHFQDIDITPSGGEEAQVLCSNIDDDDNMGLECTGPCPSDWPQHLDDDHFD